MEKKVIELEVAEEVETSGVSAISLVDVPAIETLWMAFEDEEQEFVNPRSGESKPEFISRCIAFVIAEGKEPDQAAAICYSTYENMDIDNPCWDGYEPYGLKDNGAPNCVKIKAAEEEFSETYTDYPEAAVNNARRALAWVEENGWGDCGMGTGKARARQLANREPISEDTIARMSAFQRHRQNKDTPYGEGCGKLMWDSWGGEAGVSWAEKKLKEIHREEMSYDTSALPVYVDETIKRKIKMSAEDEVYDTIEEAQARSEELGLKGEIHSHATDDGFIFMPGASHDDLEEALEEEMSMQFKRPASGNPGDRPLARIPKADRGRTGSRVNKPGDSKTSRGGTTVPAEVEKTLRTKIDEHNEEHPEATKKADMGMLKAVWSRGAGAYSVGTPGRRGMTRQQWAMGRVNAFLNILAGKRSGYDKNYTQDNDLLPKGNPKHSEKKMSMMFASEDQQIVVGPVAIPDKEIFRKNPKTGETYYVSFTKEVVQKMAEKFMRENRGHETNVQHESEDNAGSYVMENWIVETKDDKANTKYGLDVPIGTWMVSMRVQDPAVWKQIKDGKLRGFSLEGNFMDKKDYEAYQQDKQIYERVIKILKSI